MTAPSPADPPRACACGAPISTRNMSGKCRACVARGARPATSAADFWSKVDKSGGPDACWPWLGWKDKDGYGALSFHDKFTRAHRLAAHFAGSPVPDDLLACHSCDNPACCNPAHIFPGTYADNAADMTAKGRGRDGGRNGRTKLSAEAVAQIRELIGTMPQREIGARFGVCQAYVSRIKRGENRARA